MAIEKAKVHILYTGGTIGMAPESEKPGSPLVPQPLDELLKYIPALHIDERFELTYESFDVPLDSSNLGPEHWKDMATRVERAYSSHDGFIILHGTDTMAYTASALAFMFENLGKPVIITGSQLPISEVRTDAIMNLVNSVYIAGYKQTGLPCVPEVVIVFADKILRGCRARKTSASSWAGFDSPNLPPLGHIGEHIKITASMLRSEPLPGQAFQVNLDLNTEVMDIALTPGFRPSHLRRILLGHDDIKAIVLRTYGAGNAPNQGAFLDVIEEVHKEKKTVLNVTQCLEGTVEMGLYAASSGLLERGVISALDMTPEAALTKLMWTLGTKIGDQVVTQMQVNQRGEQSENLFDLRYGAFKDSSEPQARFVHYVTPDRRLEVKRLSRAVVRFTGIGFSGVPIGEQVQIRIFMNLPSATAATAGSHSRCVAELNTVWNGSPQNLSVLLDDLKTRSSIGDGDITLTVVLSNADQTFWFKGLFLAIFAAA